MSMHSPLFGAEPIPEETRRAAEAAFPHGSPVLRLRDHFGMLYHNQLFAHLFARDGQPALSPARLALVCVLQFMDDVTDRQAADAVRARIDWKYALGLPLDDPGFHYSALSDFRARLLPDNPEGLLLETLLDLLADAKLLKAHGKQRTDSTHVLAAIRHLDRLELVGETMRSVLNALADAAPDWLLSIVDPAWLERYSDHMDSYRLPKAHSERDAVASTIAEDGFALLAAIAEAGPPASVLTLPAVGVLRAVWREQFYRCSIPGAYELRWRTSEEQPPASTRLISPHDPEARYGEKRGQGWEGYKVHLTEVCEAELPHVITDVQTTPATTADSAQTSAIQQRLLDRGVAPGEHYLDAGYMSAASLVASQAAGITLLGPVGQDTSWQARQADGLAAQAFVLDWEAEVAVCPAGQPSQRWREEQTGGEQRRVVIGWSAQACGPCALRERCTHGRGGRTLKLLAQPEYDALAAARALEETATFKAGYRVRAGVEGSFSQGNRRCGLRHARYRGQAKTQLQQLFSAIALTLIRVIAWLMAQEDGTSPHAKTRVSSFTKLMLRYQPLPAC